jgi:FtsZ-binding cell division protein ZapB
MKQIEKAGKLDDWCKDNVDWLKKTFGADNLVSAVLHLDEKTPHIHATVVPIVAGERRKAKIEKPAEGKKKYKKKNPNAARLCADDIIARDKLTDCQDSYARAMEKYGLKRGIEGSEARHITTQQYYRELHLQNEHLKENIQELQEQKAEANQQLSRIKSGIKTEKLKSSAVDVATSAIEGIGSVLGTSKVKRQQQEIEELKTENAGLQTEIKTLKQQIQASEKEHKDVTDRLRGELDRIHALFPKIRELLRMENLCRYLGFGDDLTKSILSMKPVAFRGKLYSSEYRRHFETERSVTELKSEPNDPNKLRLTIDGVSVVSWFRQKHGEFLQMMGIKVNQEPRRSKVVKM